MINDIKVDRNPTKIVKKTDFLRPGKLIKFLKKVNVTLLSSIKNNPKLCKTVPPKPIKIGIDIRKKIMITINEHK